MREPVLWSSRLYTRLRYFSNVERGSTSGKNEIMFTFIFLVLFCKYLSYEIKLYSSFSRIFVLVIYVARVFSLQHMGFNLLNPI